ncbi:cysteine synthase A [Buchnera aphidicola]|uniref:cysteine synthase A n=1 Tax=Buchnera aphidicola TaxID=9 RepID=UPI003464D7EF
MKTFYQDNSLTIGNTPLVRLKSIGNKRIFAKIESRNPSFSVKCRIGANMIWEAEKKGLINKDTHLIEATSGNTGIALAYVAAARKYKITLTMPETMSIERQKLLIALGAKLQLTNKSDGMQGAINQAQKIAKQNPKKYILLEQFSNPANPKIHEITTGPEIWKSLNNKIDILVAGVGTGGTITGITKYIKNIKRKPNLISVAVEPSDSPVISQTLYGLKIKPGPHKIQGIGAGFIPKNLKLELIDEVIQVSNEEAFIMSHALMKKEGILSGISSGAALAAALKIQKRPNFNKKNIVVILPSSAERYLSTELFSDEYYKK